MNGKIIVAYDQNHGIGFKGKIPWNLKEDLEWFKYITDGHVIIMGRKTWDSLPKQPLPNRHNIVMTSMYSGYGLCHKQKNVWFMNKSLHTKFLELLSSRFKPRHLFFIGGESIYRTALTNNWVNAIYVTQISSSYKCDRHFPYLDVKLWKKRLLFSCEKFSRYLYTKIN